MSKPSRSPILGYNHNIRFHGRVFHVQTEDSGTAHSRLFTHLFYEGTILASKKHEYDADAPEDTIRLLMQRLHKAMIRELKEGIHDPRIGGFFAARGETIQLGDKPTLLPVDPAAAVAARAPASMRVADEPPVADDRPAPISGSIDVVTTPLPAAAPAPPPPAAPPAVAARPLGPVGPHRPVVVVRPPDVKRQPSVSVSNSAEGVVVKRNVVINVGGGAAPVQGQTSRGTAAPRAPVPYVVREGSYTLPTVSRGSGPTPPAPEAPPPASTRDLRMPWDSPASGAVEAALRGRVPSVPSEMTPAGRAVAPDATARPRTAPPAAAERPPSERTPAERAFASDLISDKSLDEVILEYLSDDSEPE